MRICDKCRKSGTIYIYLFGIYNGTKKKKQIEFGHCVVCVKYYWNIVHGIRTCVFGTEKEFEFASCGRDLRSIAEMMNNFHHERLKAAWRMIYE